MKVFREIFQICPKLPNQEFDALPSNEEIVSFIKELGHKGDIKSVSDAVVDHMYQPWRTFASIINKSEDDNILGLMRFVSKSKDFQVYGALLPEVMTNQKMRNSHAYKTYLAYATGAATPKKARKFKKPASPSKKRTLVTVEEEEPEPAKKVVPGEPKGKSIDTSEGTGLKPGIPDVSKTDSSKSEYESWGDSGDEANVQETNDDEEKSDDEFIHTPPNYVRIDDETNDESNDVDKEEFDRIDKELYGDVNVSFTDAEQDDGDKEDADMTDVAHVQVKQTQEQTTGIQEENGPDIATVQGQYVVQATTTTTPSIQNATTKVPPFSSNHFVSSNYTSAFLNLENLQSTKTEVVSMLDINVQHEVPPTSQLLTIHVSVIPKHTVFSPSETIITAPEPTITSLLFSIYHTLLQTIPIPTPTNTEATTSTPTILESETLNVIHLRLSDLEKEAKELNNVDQSLALLLTIKFEKHSADVAKEHLIPAEIVERLGQQYVPQKSTDGIRQIKMEQASKQQVPKFTITSSDTTALVELDQKTTLFNTMTNNKSFNKSPKLRALYHALMESILKDEDAMDEGVTNKLKKRKPNDTNQDEGPSTGSDQGLKR
ncbi:hypothetical protein Tco_1440261 [Tanacetum coccineum]